jgi:hypothetical protein
LRPAGPAGQTAGALRAGSAKEESTPASAQRYRGALDAPVRLRLAVGESIVMARFSRPMTSTW